MKVVDAVQINVFFMPSEHCLPRSHIQVRVIDPGDRLLKSFSNESQKKFLKNNIKRILITSVRHLILEGSI